MVTIQHGKSKISATRDDNMPHIIRLAGSVCPIIFMVMVSITYLCDYIAFLNGGGYLAQLKVIKENGFSGLEEVGTNGFISAPSGFAFSLGVYLILFLIWAGAMFVAYMMTSERRIIPMLIDVVVMIVAVVSIVSNGIKLLEYSADVDQYYMDMFDYNMGIENSGSSLIVLKIIGFIMLLIVAILVFDILILLSSTTRWMMVNKIKAYAFGIIISWAVWLLMNVVPIIALVIFIVVVIVLLFVEVKFLIVLSEDLAREYWMLRKRISKLELNMEIFPNSRKYPKWQIEHDLCCERLQELADILHY